MKTGPQHVLSLRCWWNLKKKIYIQGFSLTKFTRVLTFSRSFRYDMLQAAFKFTQGTELMVMAIGAAVSGNVREKTQKRDSTKDDVKLTVSCVLTSTLATSSKCLCYRESVCITVELSLYSTVCPSLSICITL